jgi:hypothetical protein
MKLTLLDRLRRLSLAASLVLLGVVSPAGAAGDTDCPGDIDGDGAVSFGDLLGLLSSWGECDACAADLDGDGMVAFGDLLLVLGGWGPCPAACDFEDVRTEVEFAADDPPHIQRNYDAINRTTQLFRDVKFETWFDFSFAALRPAVQPRLESLEACTGLPVDVAAISSILDELEDVGGDVTIREIITAVPGEREDVKSVLDQLRLHGIGFPPSATDPLDAEAKMLTIDMMLLEAPDLTYRDLYWIDPELVSDAALEALDLAKLTRVSKYTRIDPDSGDVLGICDNDRCCHKYQVSGVEINECIAREDNFCKKRIDGNLCRINADVCP